MRHQFTAAAERALLFASGWKYQSDCNDLEAQTLLIGLLSESECQAAVILGNLGIDISALRDRWPLLAPVSQDDHLSPPRLFRDGGNWATESARENAPLHRTTSQIKRFSADVKIFLQLAEQQLALLPQPLELATEHILLGMASADHEVSHWLRERGLDPGKLEADIYARHGYTMAQDCAESNEPAGEQKPGDNLEGEKTTPFEALKPNAPLKDLPVANAANETRCQRMETLRLFDAAANRAREGLRVVEDHVRFALDDRHLTSLCKQLRHDLTAALRRIPTEHLLAARETEADVGTALTTSSERTRADLTEVLTANFARLQESLRSLEEFGKLLDADIAAIFKQLRYQTYTLQRAVIITGESVKRLERAKLYVLIDGRASGTEFQQLVQALIEAGVSVLQLRDKQLDDRTLLERARLLRSLTRETETIFVMNDRPDLAVLAQADGVHVGQEELSVKDARTIVGPDALVGVSTHSIEQARRAVLDGANYIGVGPTFPSGTKSFEQFPGTELLRQVATEIRLPAFAIGGIKRQNLAEVLATGITRAAVSGGVLSMPNPAAEARELLRLLSGLGKAMSEGQPTGGR